MSKMAELDMQIREMLDDGVAPPTIAKILEVSLGMVYAVLESYPDPDEYNDSMDGDHDSAMASAGFGTDEDYGHYGED